MRSPRLLLRSRPARAVAQPVRDAVKVQRKGSGKSLRLKLASFFSWQVSINEEKGTAGGSIKLNFPIQSSLIVGLLCLGIALVIGTVSQFVIPAIFLLFALHHLGRWVRSLVSIRETVELESPGESSPEVPRRRLPHGLLRRSLRRGVWAWARHIVILVPGFLFIELCAVVTLGVTCGPFWGGLHLLIHRYLVGEEAAGMFDGFRDGRFVTLVLLFYTEAGLVAVGTVLGVIPGVLIVWLWLYAFSFAAIEGKGYLASIRASIDLVLAHPVRHLLLAVGIQLLGVIPAALGVFALLAQAVVAPLVVAIVAAAFIEARGGEIEPPGASVADPVSETAAA